MVEVAVPSSLKDVLVPRARRILRSLSTPGVWSRPAVAGLLLTGLVAFSLALRFEQLGTALWGDEGISVGIASHPLGELPEVLAKDGAPPLYYVLLRGWMGVTGRSETQTHALSLILALATIPVGLWAGWSLFGRRVGWTLAVLAATTPYLTEYSGETRMYTLVVLLALVATTAFVHGFAFGRRHYLPLFFASLLLLLYTHYWGLYFAASAVVALVPCYFATEDRQRLVRDASLGFATVALFFLPWLPTLLEQQRRTGAPWSWAPAPREALSALAYTLGDGKQRVLVALAVTAGVALVPLVRSVREPEGAAVAAMALMGSLTLAAGWMVSQVKPNWAQRYLAVVLPAALLLGALGTVRSKVPGMVALVIILLVWVDPFGRLTAVHSPVDPESQSPNRQLARAVRPYLGPDDVVVAIQMEEVPVLRYYLGPRLRFADPSGPVRDPQLVDWRDAMERMERSSPEVGLAPLLETLRVDGRVLLVCPRDSVPEGVERWFVVMESHCVKWKATLEENNRVRSRPVPGLENVIGGSRGQFAWLYEKTSP